MIKEYLPISNDGLSEAANFIEPDAFIDSVESYRSGATQLLADQPLSSYFLATQKDQIDYSIRYYTNWYLANYGIDPKKQQESSENLAKGISKRAANNLPMDTAQLMKEVQEMENRIHVRKLSQSDRRRLTSIVWNDFDINKEDLYRFSPEYRKLVDLALMRYQFKMDGAKYLQSKNDNEYKIAIVKGEITNRYIREALLYRFTKLLLQSGAHDIDRYFTGYIDSSIDSLHATDIRDIYNKLKKYAPGSMAPEFTYKDVKGNIISLSSLKGHYVYIDIWAT
jgi:hypothetical protein